jgi:hypothetical protein
MKFDNVIAKKRYAPPALTVLAPDDRLVRQAAARSMTFADAVKAPPPKL